MNEINATTLADLTIDALERTAFVVAEPAEEEFMDDLAECEWGANIKYSGPQVGQVYLSASTGFILELAASILGTDVDEVTVEIEGQDALREMSNIVGGSIVSELGGDRCELSLGLPGLVKLSDMPKFGENAVRCILDSDGERLDVIWVPEATSASKAA